MREFEILSRADSSKTELFKIYNKDFEELILEYRDKDPEKFEFVKHEVNMLPGFSFVITKDENDNLSITINVVSVPLCEKCIPEFITQCDEKINDIMLRVSF